MVRIIGLMDLDYFYAQCEQLRRPELKGKPVVVVMPSIREGSGAIATCNYEARALKIKSGMPLSLAKKLANPQTVFINVDKSYYLELSQKVFDVIDFFCEKVEQVSIDEAYFELTDPAGFDKAKETCTKIKQRIKSEIGLTCSIGLSINKLLAKIAASVKKPDGLFVIEPKDVDSFLSKQKVGALHGVGPKSEEIFAKHGIAMVSDIKKFQKKDLIEWFGDAIGARFYDFAFGIDERAIESNREKQQLSRMMTISKDSREFDALKQNIDFLSGLLFSQIHALKKRFKTVSLIIVTTKMEMLTKSRTSAEPIEKLEELREVEYELLKDFLSESQSIVRRVGVRVSNFDEDTGFQQKLGDFSK